eukprot:jgi/Ulvmu1/12023/UM083_0036.1
MFTTMWRVFSPRRHPGFVNSDHGGRHAAFDCLSHCRTRCIKHSTQPLIDRPSVDTVSFTDVFAIFSRCQELILSEASPLAGNEAPSKQDLQTELAWLFEDAIESVSLGPGAPQVLSAAQLRSLSVLRQLDGYNFRIRLPLTELWGLWQSRVKERCPLQYLVGASHWRDIVLAVGPGVLIPRPETENIIDFCNDALKRHPDLGSGCWVDLGTGSGALACAIARLLQARPQPAAAAAAAPRVVAVDLSPVAVEYAQLNAERLGVRDIVDVRHGSWCQPCMSLQGSVSGLVSNPPYIPAGDMGGLQLEVQWHEPAEALSDGGTDGMASLHEVLRCAALLLRPGGFFAFETNGGPQATQLEFMARKMLDSGGVPVFGVLTILPDYYGCHRFVSGFKSLDCKQMHM